MADPRDQNNRAVATEEPETEQPREPWPEEIEDRSKSAKARGFFQRHPAAKWLLALVVLGAIVAMVFIWLYYSVRETTDDAQIDGYIYPISSRVGGTITQVAVDDNNLVQQNQVLIQLDPRDYEVTIQRARGDLADAQATARAAQAGIPITATTTQNQIANARANLAAAEKEVTSAEARVREAEANHNKVAQDLQRFQELVKKDEISHQQYDAAVAAEQSAQATLDATHAAVSTAQSHVLQADAQVKTTLTAPQQVTQTEARAGAAGATVQARNAAVSQAELNLGYTTVRAPVTGIVSKRSAQPGQVVQPGQPLLSVVDVGNLWVTANFKETQLKNIRLGQRARVHVDAFDRDFEGHVDSFGGATGARFSLLPPENATGNFVKVVQRVPVKIILDKNSDSEHLLRPGMSIEATVITK